MTQGYNVLVVDDDKEIREGITIYLKNEGMNVFQAKDGIEALERLNEEDIHLMLLDVMMPRLDGIQTTLKIREARNIPIIFLSAKSEEADKVLGLQVGGDDYVTKPFNPLELIARVKSQLRRYVNLGTYEQKKQLINLNGITLDLDAKEVKAYGEPVKLTPIEYRIIELLMTNAGRVFSIAEIYERVWNEPSFQSSENTVAVHIRKIREKIEIDPSNPRHLKVVWGIGYKMER
ncbi:response regulator transcription factor [Halalkalibacterium halodurans]|uniref:Two-component response regulator n=3 Tax=Halalkalibacterium halodurans TaxID=86665 RepID=Q9KDQ8_HALH5|nr:response regulator transcription factor [Halalkalibacterium halodurans]MDY7221685.1 response regulator transcription factor [Halalkalibacterium halodurans]MDY7240961.1 response regulator transcription factor [Halalkalibacterium halodurans]MED4079356.1 response regulator transcription factor [Halalkalibacterium halodurans]MED4085427.1 response regulator transcription factor [Halalkalibacterium halodurans]MED4104449.1 response regulator transcription factor [Halalkalibacterium halodurans]